VVANVSLPPVRKTNPIATTGSGTIRSPKTAELVARTLRRMVVDGDLKDGDYLPNEAELMTHFGVSRPTLREAVRLLESERLVEVRRGSRTGARVRMPGPEIVARPVGLLLEVAGATMADVMVARSGIEPLAARLLAEQGTPSAIDELELILTDEVPTAWRSGRLAEVTAKFHRRLVELSGNATLSVIAGMLHEISERHTEAALKERRTVPRAHYDKLVKSYGRLIELLRAGKGVEAEAHWRRHMDNSRSLLLRGQDAVKVRDMLA
jgi:GntR family transcriptional regulator, transcriptional repressor for pyruvate dehydrogenase complex